MATSYPKRHTTGGVWKVTNVAKNLLTKGTWPGGGTPGTRGIFSGGAPGPYNIIDYVTISTAGDAADFGDLSATMAYLGPGPSSFTRGIVVSGGSPASNVIEYVTMASTGNSADFGDLTTTARGPCGVSNSVRGLFGGRSNPGIQNIIDYITIATVGNATDFGDLSESRETMTAIKSPTRAIFAGGDPHGSPRDTDTMDFVEFLSLGTAVDFGNLTSGIAWPAGCSSSTRGVVMGGTDVPAAVDVIQYVTIAAKSNITDFGDLLAGIYSGGGADNSVRGIHAGGVEPTNVIQYITIATTGDSADFGDLTQARTQLSSISDGHGGLEAFDPRLIPMGSRRGLFCGGATPSANGVITYINISTTGNSVTFGNLQGGSGADRNNIAAVGSQTRALMAGGGSNSGGVSNQVQTIEIHSLGNAADFGDLTNTKRGMSPGSNLTRAVFLGGEYSEGGRN